MKQLTRYKFMPEMHLEQPSALDKPEPSREILVPRMFWGRPPPTFPGRSLKILFDHPGEVTIWRSRDVLVWRPGDVLIWRPRDVPERFIRDVPKTFSGRPIMNTQIFWTMWGHLLNFSKFLLAFLSKLIPLTKSI